MTTTDRPTMPTSDDEVPGVAQTDDTPPTAKKSSSARPADQSLLRAALAYPLQVMIPVVILVAGALLLSLQRAPIYTAEARVSVGRIDVATQAIPGVVAGTQALASSYSRLVDAEEVLDPVSSELGIPTDDLEARLSGSPIVESPLFIVEATGSNEDQAIELVNAAADSLQSYVSTLNRTNDDSEVLLQEYGDAVVQAAQARGALRRVQQNGTPAQVLEAQGSSQTAALQVDVLAGLYRESRQGRASSNQLQIINRASTAVDDGSSFRQRALFLAVLAGLIIGLILAGLAARRGEGFGRARAKSAGRARQGS